jgi:hypothetical protein
MPAALAPSSPRAAWEASRTRHRRAASFVSQTPPGRPRPFPASPVATRLPNRHQAGTITWFAVRSIGRLAAGPPYTFSSMPEPAATAHTTDSMPSHPSAAVPPSRRTTARPLPACRSLLLAPPMLAASLLQGPRSSSSRQVVWSHSRHRRLARFPARPAASIRCSDHPLPASHHGPTSQPSCLASCIVSRGPPSECMSLSCFVAIARGTLHIRGCRVRISSAP